jgi:hypothetical protein
MKFVLPRGSTACAGRTFSNVAGNSFPSMPTTKEIDDLAKFVESSKSMVAITGAGISTASGIPDYRGPQGSYKLGHKPMTHQDFMTKEASRQRFWSRNFIGWQSISKAAPNAAHHALASFEKAGKLKCLVTQNVDRLHQTAGSRNVSDIHGTLDAVRCQSCKAAMPRKVWQEKLMQQNSAFLDRWNELKATKAHSSGDATNPGTGTGGEDPASRMRADGDADLTGLMDYTQVL